MFWSTIGRLIIVPLAFLISATAALLVLFSLGTERVTQAVHSRNLTDGDPVFAAFDLFREGIILVSGLTILPALAIVILGEVARIRSSLYYVFGGGAALAAIPLLARLNQVADLNMPASSVWQVFATAGFVGGFVYWMLAGRRA